VILVAFAAATLGGIVGWLVGLLAGRSALTAPGPLRKARIHAAKRGEQLFRRWEIAAILLTPSWVAGINRARTGVYQLTNVVSAFLWAVALGVGAYYAGPPVLDVFNDTTTIAFVALVAVVVGGVGLELVRRRRRRALRLER
jgi:membrane protein DedA with SNARE-associated domain